MRKRRVIVYDDEAIIARMFKMYFSSLDYEVLAYSEPRVACPVSGSSSAVCNKKSACADVVIADFQMPGMNGLQLLEMQQQNGCKLTIRNKAIVSAYLENAQQQRIEQLGCAFFHKPVDFSEFSVWLSECEQRIDLSQPLASRRKADRISDDRQIMYRADENGEILKGTAVDISDSGLRLRLSSPLATGQIIHIDTELPNACRQGVVIWTLHAGDGTHLAGLVRSEGINA
ncbi:MAG TPA: response regulator [Nitrospirota bacterium]